MIFGFAKLASVIVLLVGMPGCSPASRVGNTRIDDRPLSAEGDTLVHLLAHIPDQPVFVPLGEVEVVVDWPTLRHEMVRMISSYGTFSRWILEIDGMVAENGRATHVESPLNELVLGPILQTGVATLMQRGEPVPYVTYTVEVEEGPPGRVVTRRVFRLPSREIFLEVPLSIAVS